jgi:hypothetical protein
MYLALLHAWPRAKRRGFMQEDWRTQGVHAFLHLSAATPDLTLNSRRPRQIDCESSNTRPGRGDTTSTRSTAIGPHLCCMKTIGVRRKPRRSVCLFAAEVALSAAAPALVAALPDEWHARPASLRDRRRTRAVH